MFKLARKSLFFRARTVGGQYQEAKTDYHYFILRGGKYPIQITCEDGACKEEQVASLIKDIEAVKASIEALPNERRGYLTWNRHTPWLMTKCLGNGLAYWSDQHPGYYSGEIGKDSEVVRVFN